MYLFSLFYEPRDIVIIGQIPLQDLIQFKIEVLN
jgi:hypothetical protein